MKGVSIFSLPFSGMGASEVGINFANFFLRAVCRHQATILGVSAGFRYIGNNLYHKWILKIANAGGKQVWVTNCPFQSLAA